MLWQSGFHEWTVRNLRDYGLKREYIRMNPVKRELMGRPEESEFGSACGRYRLDPAPQGLKPLGGDREVDVIVGAKAPTSGTTSSGVYLCSSVVP